MWSSSVLPSREENQSHFYCWWYVDFPTGWPLVLVDCGDYFEGSVNESTNQTIFKFIIFLLQGAVVKGNAGQIEPSPLAKPVPKKKVGSIPYSNNNKYVFRTAYL